MNVFQREHTLGNNETGLDLIKSRIRLAAVVIVPVRE